jgi:hypothetical protein
MCEDSCHVFVAAAGRLIEFSDPKKVAADVGSMLHAVAAEAGL